MTNSSVSIGIDIGKHFLDVSSSHAPSHQRFANAPQGMADLRKYLSEMAIECIVCEPSGGYERLLLETLHKAGLPVSLVNARHIRDFARSRGILAKTDKIDARVLAEYGAMIRPDPSPARPQTELGWYVARRNQLVAMASREKQALEQPGLPDAIRQSIDDHIARLKAECRTLEGHIRKYIEADAECSRKKAILTSCKGVGEITAATLIAQLPELGKTSHAKLAALCGIAPFNCDSGTRKGGRRIQGGRAPVRKALYMAALTAIRCNPDIKERYHTLRNNGKHAKVAIVAVMRTLLKTLNSLVHHNRTWKESYKMQT